MVVRRAQSVEPPKTGEPFSVLLASDSNHIFFKPEPGLVSSAVRSSASRVIFTTSLLLFVYPLPTSICTPYRSGDVISRLTFRIPGTVDSLAA